MLTRSSGRYSARSVSSRRTVPECGATSPEITSSVVVFPEPLAPMRPTMAPGSASNDTPSRAWTPPKCTCSPSTLRRAGWAEGAAAWLGAADRHLSAPSATSVPAMSPTLPEGATGGPACRAAIRSWAPRIPSATRSPARRSSSASPPGR